MEKIYDMEGVEELRFGIGDEERVKQFTNESDISKFKIVDDEVFGKAYSIPCIIVEEDI